MKLGHIVSCSPCPASRRHFPTPTQRSTACEKSPRSCANAKCVAFIGPFAGTERRKFSSIRYGLTTLPGFIFPSGSQIPLNSRNACTRSAPNIFGKNSARACPSPCSPDSEPSYRTQRFVASSINARHFLTPAVVTRSKFTRL